MQDSGETFHRRVPYRPSMLTIDQVTQKIIGVTSAAFRPDNDGLSFYVV